MVVCRQVQAGLNLGKIPLWVPSPFKQFNYVKNSLNWKFKAFETEDEDLKMLLFHCITFSRWYSEIVEFFN